jgi:hypothetical protein
VGWSVFKDRNKRMKYLKIVILQCFLVSMMTGHPLFAETSSPAKNKKSANHQKESRVEKTESELGSLAKETAQAIQPLAKDVEKALKPLAKKAKGLGKELKKGLKEDLQKKPDSGEPK